MLNMRLDALPFDAKLCRCIALAPLLVVVCRLSYRNEELFSAVYKVSSAER